MIKYFFLFLFTCLIYLCSCSKRTIVYAERISDSASNYVEDIPDSTAFEVMEIRKENSWYFIYLLRNDSIFKVVSHEPRYVTLLENSNRKIEVGGKYNLSLSSWRDNKFIIDGVNEWPLGYTGGFNLDSETTVSLEPENGIWDLYDAEELVGLYFLSGSRMSKIQPLL